MTDQVLTLAAESGGLTADVTAAATNALRKLGARVETPQWLAPGVACDLMFEGAQAPSAEVEVDAALAQLAVDFAVQPRVGRRKRLLIADMESTVIRNEMLDELADFAGQRDRVADITERAMQGELDFFAAIRERVALLAGLPVSVIQESAERIEIDPGAETLVRTMNAAGASTALVSGGFDVFAEPVAQQLGFDLWRANRLLIRNDQLSGSVAEPILGRDAKLAVLRELCDSQRIGADEVVAVGDGANDLAMLKAAGLGVAFHAKPAVVEAARFNVRHGDLRTLLYFQGYRQDEFITA